MTLPGSGPITYGDINTEMGRVATWTIDMGFIYDNTKSGQQSYALNNYYSKAYYQRNVDGNCNNGNCNCAGNCPSYDYPQNCENCINCYNVNCFNCDARGWLQNNCNCASTPFNCEPTELILVNCNCFGK